jgi:hypothetical protein
VNGGQKVVVVVLVAVVGLFVVALVLPARSGSGGDDLGKPPGGLVGLLGDRLGRTADVQRGDLSAPCLQAPDRLVFTGGCALSVAPSSGRQVAGRSLSRGLRIVHLRPQDDVHLTTRAPNSDLEISQDVERGKKLALPVDDDGATIGLTCAGLAQSCTVTVETGTEP